MAPRKQKNITFNRIDTIEFHGILHGGNMMLALLDEQTYEHGATRKIGIMAPPEEIKILAERLAKLAAKVIELRDSKELTDGSPSTT